MTYQNQSTGEIIPSKTSHLVRFEPVFPKTLNRHVMRICGNQ